MDIVIAHRGLFSGPNEFLENEPNHIEKNIQNYPQIINEIDVWISNEIYLGHDNPDHKIEIDFLRKFSKNLILHLKNIDLKSDTAMTNFQEIVQISHTFCHEDDNFTITSKNWIWLHPNNKIKENCIVVMPEKFLNLDIDENIKLLKKAKGVCSDYPLKMLRLVN